MCVCELVSCSGSDLCPFWSQLFATFPPQKPAGRAMANGGDDVIARRQPPAQQERRSVFDGIAAGRAAAQASGRRDEDDDEAPDGLQERRGNGKGRRDFGGGDRDFHRQSGPVSVPAVLCGA